MNLKLVDVSNLPPKSDAADFSEQEFFRILGDSSVSSNLDQENCLTADAMIRYASRDHTMTAGTEFPVLDNILSMPKTGLVVVAGRPAHGKSSLMRNIALRKTLQNKKVVYLTLEMGPYEELLCFIKTLEGSISSEIPHEDLMLTLKAISKGNSKGFNILAKYLNKNLFINYNITTIQQICEIIRSPKYEGASVFLDYIQLVKTSTGAASGQGSALQLQEIMNELRSAAIDNELLIFLGSQLTATPLGTCQQDVVKGGRCIEEAASVLLRVWRCGIKSGNQMDDILMKVEDCEFSVHVEKNRFGISGRSVGLHTLHGIILRDPSEMKLNIPEVYSEIVKKEGI